MLATRSPELKKAVGVLKELSADERMRMLAEAREKARRDEASRVNWAVEEGERRGEKRGEKRGMEQAKREIARAMKSSGDSSEKIQTITGLPLEVIENL